MVGSFIQCLGLAVVCFLLEPVLGIRVTLAIGIFGWVIMPYVPKNNESVDTTYNRHRLK